MVLNMKEKDIDYKIRKKSLTSHNIKRDISRLKVNKYKLKKTNIEEEIDKEELLRLANITVCNKCDYHYPMDLDECPCCSTG